MKETVQEAAKKYSVDAKGTNYPIFSEYDLVTYERAAFRAGATWQLEQSKESVDTLMKEMERLYAFIIPRLTDNELDDMVKQLKEFTEKFRS